MATGGKDEVSFRFKRTTRGIDVVSFRRTGYVEEREIDVDDRPIDKHSVFTDNQQFYSELQQILSQKKYTFILNDVNRRLLDPFFRGYYSTSYDARNPGPKEEWYRELESRPITDNNDDSECIVTGTAAADPDDQPRTEATGQASTAQAAGMSFGMPSMPAPGSSANDWQAFSMHSMMAMQQQMMNLQQQLQMMQLSGGSRDKMNITRTDGTSEDPHSWLKFYELVCNNNGWNTDKQKVMHLKSALIPGSAADRWFCSRVIDCEDAPWHEWRSSFLQAFSLNRVAAAQAALQFQYRSGKLLDYFYEKERLLKLAFNDLSSDSFITLVLVGLPSHMQENLLGKQLVNKTDLVTELNKLAPLYKRPEHLPRFQQPTQQSSHGKSRLTPVEHERRSDNKGSNQQQHTNRDDKKASHYGNKNGFKGNRPHANAIKESTTGVKLVVDLPDDRDKVSACVTPAPLALHQVLVNGQPFMALLDSGSQRDLIATRIIKQQSWEVIDKKTAVIAFNACPATSKGSTLVTVAMHPESSLSSPVEVASEALIFDDLPYDVLVGSPTLAALGIEFTVKMTHVNSISGGKGRISSMSDVERIFPDLLREDRQPQFTVPFAIEKPELLTPCKPFRLSPEKQEKLRTALDSMLERGIIRPSQSKVPAPLVAVSKPNGTVRPCVSYKQHNELTKLDVMPFPFIDDVIMSYGGCHFFTKIDLRDGFFQIALTEATKHLTAFITPWEIYESNRLPFGWKNSPPIFQRILTRVLGDLLHHRRVHVYVDDISCGAPTKEENEHLTFLIMQRLDANGFMINAKKCDINQSSITLLGRVIDGQSRTTRLETVEKVKNMRAPHDRKSLMQYRGLLGHFRSWIPNFAGLMRPLDALTRKDQPFVWTPACQHSFETLNQLVTSEPILCQPDWSLHFELCCDASHLGTGAVLYQHDPTASKGKEKRLIAFHSYTFTKPEINYTVTEKECLAVVKAVKYFRSMLDGRSCTVHSDHQALSTLLDMKEAKNRLARWQLFLLTFNLTINHRSGKHSADADAISRLCLQHETPVVAFMISSNQLTAEDKAFLLKRFHDDSDSGGHGGQLRTYLKLKARFADRWPGLKSDVEAYVRSCAICQAAKFKYRAKRDYQYLTPHATTAFHTICLDYGETTKKSEACKTTRSFLLLTDEYTRFIVAKAMRQTARGLIKFLEEQPFLPQVRRIICDNGPSFASAAFMNWCKDKDITLAHSAPYHPQGNALSERNVQAVKTFMSCYRNHPGGWKSCLYAATKLLNRSYNRIIGCSPFFKLHGHSQALPADIELGLQAPPEQAFTDEQVVERRKKMQEAANKNKPRPQFDVGQEILYRKGSHGKEVYGPEKIVRVITKDSVPKTLILESNKQAVAVKDALPYKRREGVSFAQATMLGLTLVAIVMPTESFTREPMVLWRKLREPAIDGYFHVRHLQAVNDTCTLDNEHFLTNATLIANSKEYEQQLLNWCHLKLHHVFFQPLQQICTRRMSGPRKQGKRKRQVVAALLGGFAVYSWFNSNSMASQAFYRAQENSAAIDKAWRDMQELGEKFKITNNVVRETLRHVSSLATHVSLLENQMKATFAGEARINMWMSKTTLRLATLATEVRELLNDWRNDKIPESFFTESIRQSLHASNIADYAFGYAIPNTCMITEDKGWAEFNYWLPRVKKDTAIYAANPFMMFKTDSDNSSRRCKIKYSGPKFAAIKGSCVQALEADEFADKRSALLMEGHACESRTAFEASKYWKIKECYDDFSPPVQVKISNSKAYVLCPGQKLQHRPPFWNDQSWVEYDCPDHPISISNTESFKINNFTYDHASVTSESSHVASPFEITLLNDHLYPLSTENESKIISELQSMDEQLLTNSPNLLPFYGSHGSSLLTLIAIIMSVLMIIFLCFFSSKHLAKKHRRRRSRRRQRKTKDATNGNEANVLVLGELSPRE